MTLDKQTFIDQITIEPHTGSVWWREATVITEDGKELSRTYHRGMVEADGFGNTPPPDVLPYRAVAATPDKIAKARARREESPRRMPPPKV